MPNHSTPTPTMHPTDTAILETFIPGYAFISRLLQTHLHIDPSIYVPYILVAGVTAAVFKYVFAQTSNALQRHFVSTAEIRDDDEIYNYLMFWLARQEFAGQAKTFVAGTKVKGRRYGDDDDDDDDEDEDEYSEYGSCQGEDGENEYGEKKKMQDADSDGFDRYWARILSKDKFKPLEFTPAAGTHIFRFKGWFIWLDRQVDEKTPYVNRSDKLYLSCLGRDPTILKDLLSEAQKAYVEKDGSRTIIYRGQRDGLYHDWMRCMARNPRPLSTVILDERQKRAFVADLKEYLHPRTRRWYSNRGIPYRRGYLLHGPPGTGKTSLCAAAAGLLGLKLYLLSLNSGSLDEDGLMSLFHELPRRCIVLLEDVDSAGMTQKREVVADGNGKSGETKGSEEADDTLTKGITLSALLNVIDGVAAAEGRILVMTTNHPEKLDQALLRPGRVDMSISFGYASTDDVEDLFSAIYMALEGDLPRSRANGAVDKVKTEASKHRDSVLPLAKEFASRVPAGELTPAEIQGYLLKHKDQPARALDGAAEWVKSVRDERANKTQTK